MWRLAEPDDDDAIVALCAALYAEDPSPVAEAPAHMAETLRALRARALHVAPCKRPIDIGVCVQIKLGSWLAIFACISSLANVKKSMVDYKQMLCSVT